MINYKRDLLIKRMFVVLLHLIFWVAFFSLPMLFRPNFGKFSHNNDFLFRMPLPILVNNIFLIIAFYVNLFVLMPALFNKKKWAWYVFATTAFLIASFFIHSLAKEIDMFIGKEVVRDFAREYPREFHDGMMRQHRTPPRGFEFRQFSFVYTFIMVWAVSMVYHLIFQLQESRRHADKVKSSALQSELSFLKAQINPHFLFNTLNNIYSLSLKKSDSTPIAIMKLSNLMRQLTNDTGVDYVNFAEEEKFIADYIELQKLRLTDKTKVIFEVSGNFNYLKIAPRLLIPFIDNAFKYGVSNRTESEIIIRILFEINTMKVLIINDIFNPGADSLETSSGIGLENVKRRLNLLYHNKFILDISNKDDKHIVNLEIDLS